MRSVKVVFFDHLKKRKDGNLEGDISENYAENISIVTRDENFYGHEGVRESASILERYAGDGTFHYEKTEVVGDIAYLVWTADTPDGKIHHGTDTLFIQNGKIQIQTIYYSLPGDKI